MAAGIEALRQVHVLAVPQCFRLRCPRAPARGAFTCRYTEQYITALARLDALRKNLSEAASRHLCQRAWLV